MVDIFFEDRKGLISLAQFHKNGGKLYDGLNVVCEKNYRSKLQTGILKTWTIGEVKFDITGLGKYSNSTTTVEIEGKIEQWPFTMLYIK